MTNPESGEAVPINEPEQMSEDNAATNKSAFLEKVSDIPVVQAAKDYGTAAYSQIKQSNQLANYTLTKAESTVLYFVLAAKPFLDKIQPQAKFVDDIAVHGLEAVETKVPFILKTPEEMVTEARKIVACTLEASYQKVDEMKGLGSGAISSVKNYGLQKVGDCLSGTEKLVDHYLPPAFGEGSSESVAEKESLGEQASRLTTKVGQRVYGHSVKQFLQVQQLSQESIAKLAYTIELLQHIKDNYKVKTMQEMADDAKIKASWIWEELSKEPVPTDAAEAGKSLEQRMLSFARRVVSTMVHTYAAIPVGNVPKVCLDKVTAARQYAAELFVQFDQATNSGEIASNLLHTARGTLSSFESAVRSIVDSFKTNEAIEMEELKKSG